MGKLGHPLLRGFSQNQKKAFMLKHSFQGWCALSLASWLHTFKAEPRSPDTIPSIIVLHAYFCVWLSPLHCKGVEGKAFVYITHNNSKNSNSSTHSFSQSSAFFSPKQPRVSQAWSAYSLHFFTYHSLSNLLKFKFWSHP